MKKHNKSIVRFFQILFASVVFSALTFCTSLKAQESFTQDFPSTCMSIKDLSKKIGEYTVLQHELIFKDTENTVHDILIGVNKTKTVLVVRELSGEVNVACVLSEFKYKVKI